MPSINDYFDLANPSGGYPYYYRKAAELCILAKDKFYNLLENTKSSPKDIEEINELLSLVHHLLTWLMFHPKANLNEIRAYRALGRSPIGTKALECLHEIFYSNKAIFLRHTETRWDLSEVISGPKNVGLDRQGVDRIYTKLSNNKFLGNVKNVYYSPNYRCKHTALVLSSMYPKMNLILELELNERFYGDVSKNISLQMELDSILKNKRMEFSAYVKKKLLDFPGHETIEALNLRVSKTFTTTLYPLIENNRNHEDYLLFVGHGSWVQSLATHLHINLKRFINSEDYAIPLLLYPFNAQIWNVVDLKKLKFVEYIVEEIAKLKAIISNIIKEQSKNGYIRHNIDSLLLIKKASEVILFLEVFIQHLPRERCPTIDLSHTLSSFYPKSYLSKLPSNEEFLKMTIDNFKDENKKILENNLWIDDNHILTMVDGVPFDKVRENHFDGMKSLEILLIRYMDLNNSIFEDAWFSKKENLLALKEIILNIGDHPKTKAKVGGEACGILIGLSPEQVTQEWFTYEHALAIQRGIAYEQVIGLTPAKALGLSSGISLKEMMSNNEFSIYHAYLMLTEASFQQIMEMSAQEAKLHYCQHLSEKDIICTLTQEGYSTYDIDSYQKIKEKEFESIFLENNHDLLMDFVLNNDNLSTIGFQGISPLVLAVNHDWEDIITVYIKKNLGNDLGNYHATVIASMLIAEKYEMAKKFLPLEINVLLSLDLLFLPLTTLKGMNVFLAGAFLPEFQESFPALFYKIPEQQRTQVLNSENVGSTHNPLSLAILNNCSLNVKFLLEMGTKVTDKIIATASKHGSSEILEIICDHVEKKGLASVFSSFSSKNPNPIILAANSKSPKKIKILLKYIKDVNAVDAEGNTALHISAQHKDFESSKLLLMHKADIMRKNIRNRSPAETLCTAGFDEILDYIPYNMQANDLSRLCSFIIDGRHLQLLKMMINKFKIDINACTISFECPLQSAAVQGDIEIVNYLLSIGADVNSHYQKGSPLYYAVGMNNIFLAELFLDKGANVNEQMFGTHHSILMYTIKHRQDKMSEMLISRKANVNLRDELNRTPLMYAAELGADSIGELLLRNGAMVNAIDVFEQNAFAYTVQKKAHAFSRLLINFGYFPNVSICEHQYITNLFAQTTLKIDHEACIEYVLEYTTPPLSERLIASDLALTLPENSSVIMPCHLLEFHDSLQNHWRPLSAICYETNGSFHYVFPKMKNNNSATIRYDMPNCQQINHFETGNYIHCEEGPFSFISPLYHNKPILRKPLDQNSANLMLAMVIGKMGSNFLQDVKKTAINFLKWFHGERENQLPTQEKITVIHKLKKLKLKLKCLLKKLEHYKEHKHILNYQFALQTHCNQIGNFLKKKFYRNTTNEVDKLSSEADCLVDELDTEISNIISHTQKTFEQNLQEHSIINKLEASKQKCYLPKFSSFCISPENNSITTISTQLSVVINPEALLNQEVPSPEQYRKTI